MKLIGAGPNKIGSEPAVSYFLRAPDRYAQVFDRIVIANNDEIVHKSY